MSRGQHQVNRFFVDPRYSIYYRCLKKVHWSNESRSQYAILFLFDGRLEYRIAEKSGELLSEQSLLLAPSLHATANGKRAEFLLLTISSSFLMDYGVRMRLVGSTATIAFRLSLVPGDRQLFQLANSLRAELLDENAGREIVIAALIEQIVVHLLRHYSNMRRSEELELSRVGLIDRRIRRAVELMNARLDQDLSLREIAAASYLSPFHFARLFKKAHWRDSHGYLAGLRTAQAQLMLADTDLSVTQISSRVGYSSPSHFTKAFRQATGVTPRAFRASLVSR